MGEFDKRSSLPHSWKYFCACNLQVTFRTRSLNNSFRVGAGDGRTDQSIQNSWKWKSQYLTDLDRKHIVEEEDTLVRPCADVAGLVFASLQSSHITSRNGPRSSATQIARFALRCKRRMYSPDGLLVHDRQQGSPFLNVPCRPL